MAIQIVGFPDELRHELADLDLQMESGQLGVADYQTARAQLIASIGTALGLDGTWQTTPTPAEPHYPTGRTSCWWKPIGGPAAPVADALANLATLNGNAVKAAKLKGKP